MGLLTALLAGRTGGIDAAEANFEADHFDVVAPPLTDNATGCWLVEPPAGWEDLHSLVRSNLRAAGLSLTVKVAVN